jgi:hypothetical protein
MNKVVKLIPNHSVLYHGREDIVGYIEEFMHFVSLNIAGVQNTT